MARHLLCQQPNNQRDMKKIPQKIQRAVHNLGELIQLVSSCSRSQRETTIAVADMIETGRIQFQSQGRKVRAHVSP